jgi:hypothetical protein
LPVKETPPEQRENWKIFLIALLAAIEKALRVAMTVVADLAPEGFSTGSYDCSENTEFQGPTGQLITTCCWNATKEAALLLGTVVTVMPTPQREEDFDVIFDSHIFLIFSEFS